MRNRPNWKTIASPLPLNNCIPHAANNQFSDNFNNGGGLLLSVVLFLMIFTFKRELEAEAYFRRRRRRRRALLNVCVVYSPVKGDIKT